MEKPPTNLPRCLESTTYMKITSKPNSTHILALGPQLPSFEHLPTSPTPPHMPRWLRHHYRPPAHPSLMIQTKLSCVPHKQIYASAICRTWASSHNIAQVRNHPKPILASSRTPSQSQSSDPHFRNNVIESGDIHVCVCVPHNLRQKKNYSEKGKSVDDMY